jgi:hypothetical protein
MAHFYFAESINAFSLNDDRHRAAFWAEDVDGLDCFRLRIARDATAFSVRNVQTLPQLRELDLARCRRDLSHLT